ncbi:hypothetical protein BGX28_006910 [Mortierella sp. GBA30]|nr:hypothetical protein BGX28_006910 [Mortierella sp. GBA30]
MDNSAAASNQDETTSSQHSVRESTVPQQQILHDESSEWETESSENEGDTFEEGTDEESNEADDEDLDEDILDDDGDFMAPDLMNWQGFLGDPAMTVDIEALTPMVRANRRPNTEDDVMSEFSGDEKYEPKETLSGENGEGDLDMYDLNPLEQFIATDADGNHLTQKIRQLMLKLTRGRKERERKLKILPSSSGPGAYLHRLIVRGPDQPKEVEHSPAVSFHQQCASSLTVTPSVMGVWDDIFTINYDSIMRCGVLDRMTESLYHSRLMAAMAMDDYDDQMERLAVHRPYAAELKTVKATKFLRTSLFRFDQLPPDEAYVPLEDDDHPLCITHKYGYLAHGTSDGNLVVYCTECQDDPIEIHNDTIAGSSLMVMVNSLQLVRWPRYYRSKFAQDEDGFSGMDSQWSNSELDQDEDEDEDDFDGQEGYPTKSGQFDHYLIMTGNDSGLFVAALPDHPNPNVQMEHGGLNQHSFDEHEHVFKFKEDHTWIRNGFNGEALNDAKASPNGRWIAIVGDSARVWTIEVTHVPETEEQRNTREEREQEILMEDLDTDSDYASDDSMLETEAKLGLADGSTIPRGEKRPRNPDEDSLSDSEETLSKSARPLRIPRLLHQFGHPHEMVIPDSIIFPSQNKRNRRPRHERREYSSQYVSWNSTSTKFAHSSDVCSRVVVWSMPSREIVCCVDVGGMGYGIEFHPRLENLFAVCNWYGFVHIVDVTGCCVGDEELVPGEAHYNGRNELGPGLAGCEGPHYEEKHDVLMLSFRGEKDRSLRILDAIRGLGWSTDGRHLYVATLRRVLRYELADDRVRIPSLFHMCARKVREWKERELTQMYTGEKPSKIKKAFQPIPEEWKYVPSFVKRKIWGDLFLMRSHDE